MDKFLEQKNSQTEKLSQKMEIEKLYHQNHYNSLRGYILSKRGINHIANNNSVIRIKSDLINTKISEIITLYSKLSNNNISLNQIKDVLFQSLKQIRQELSKKDISSSDIQNVFNNNLLTFLNYVINPSTCINEPFIQYEIFWIINNLMFLIAKFSIDMDIQNLKNITNYLVQDLIHIYQNQKNEGVKYSLEEMLLRIFGNLIYINNSLIEILLYNHIITFIMNMTVHKTRGSLEQYRRKTLHKERL